MGKAEQLNFNLESPARKRTTKEIVESIRRKRNPSDEKFKEAFDEEELAEIAREEESDKKDLNDLHPHWN